MNGNCRKERACSCDKLIHIKLSPDSPASRGGGAPGHDPGAERVSDLPLAVINVSATPTTLMVHTDHLGRPTRMTDAARATVWQASWKPWGEIENISGTILNNLRFPGQYFQIETGLAYNHHRHYDAVTGRYTQPDPLRFVDGPSVYAYAGNSPFMETDPTGEFGIAGAFVGAGFDLGMQLIMNGGRFRCISWTQVGIAAAMGSAGGFGIGSNIMKNAKSELSYWRSSHKYGSTLQRVRNANGISSGQLHHWLIPNRGWGRYVPNFIKNHPANLNPISGALNREIGSKFRWVGVPDWAKNWGSAWTGGFAGDAAGNAINGCQC